MFYLNRRVIVFSRLDFVKLIILKKFKLAILDIPKGEDEVTLQTWLTRSPLTESTGKLPDVK